MIAVATRYDTAAVTWRALLATGLLLASAFVLANDEARLKISPTYGEILSDDIYERAEGWREPPIFESEWRPLCVRVRRVERRAQDRTEEPDSIRLRLGLRRAARPQRPP